VSRGREKLLELSCQTSSGRGGDVVVVFVHSFIPASRVSCPFRSEGQQMDEVRVTQAVPWLQDVGLKQIF